MLKANDFKLGEGKEVKIDAIIKTEDWSEKESLKDKLERYFSSKKYGATISITDFQYGYWLAYIMFKINEKEKEIIFLKNNERPVLGKIIKEK